jgi:hypothetical protein
MSEKKVKQERKEEKVRTGPPRFKIEIVMFENGDVRVKGPVDNLLLIYEMFVKAQASILEHHVVMMMKKKKEGPGIKVFPPGMMPPPGGGGLDGGGVKGGTC